MSIDKEKLKALAKTASRYDWSRKSLDLSHKFPPDYELYIVECSPYKILVLLADLDQLKSENNALRKDAERYRAIRDEIPHADLGRAILNAQTAGEYDYAVDSAIDKDHP